ncbi:hypothetical protein AGMMS4952_02710 [Spirochaetia bacterium]|nr:hypothetical protein AGMMS4952_02710 [Spirochaetia bacterium]
MRNRKTITVFIICLAIFVLCLFACVLNLNYLKRPVFQKITTIESTYMAKYEKDGNLYIIDSGTSRLICMRTDGSINYTISIDKMKEYVKILDCAVDELGNLYIYEMSAEYDAYLTKRDIIRKYDKNGHFVNDIFVIDYNTSNREDVQENPHTFYQFGSMQCEDGILTFSRIQRDMVTLYRFDILKQTISSSIFSEGVSDYSVARLTLRDFENFIYTTRGGDIYEVKNGMAPLLRASFDFTEKDGGIIPWYLSYDTQGNILFFDMVSCLIFRITNTTMSSAVPREFFDAMAMQGVKPVLTGFGAFENKFAGVYRDTVWYYDGNSFKTYDEGVRITLKEQFAIAFVQLCFALGIIALLAGIYIFFVHMLDRYVSLFIKQIVVILPLTIVSFIILYSITFNHMKDRLNAEVFQKMNIAATLAAKIINGDDLDSLKSIKDYKSEEYKRLARALKEITGNNSDPWNQGYYAALYIGEHFEYCAPISNDEINLFRYASALEEDTEDYRNFMSGKPIGGIFSLVDGDWGYSAVPIYNSNGKIAGMFEIGLDMTSYRINNVKQQREIMLIAALICLVISAALIGVLSIIIKQLSSFAKVLSNIAQGNYSDRIHYRARDELGIVSRGLNAMAEELESQFEQIHSLNEATVRFVPVQFMLYLGVKDITRMKLGDHVQRNLTVLFFDIRFFSINSELMSAKENFLFINEVLSSAGPVFRAHNGFVDKYLGDAAMVLFVEARDAVTAGIELYRKLVLNKETKVRIGGDGINIGIGIHSGSVMMGIVGEDERLSSTVISKNVNLASRMESLTKQTQSGMLITRETMNQLSGSETEFQYRFIGMVQAAGTTEVIGVFDMLDALPEGTCQRRIATKKVFESGVRKYHTKDYAAARKRFEMVVSADPGDICAQNCLAETKKRLEDPSLPSVFAFDKK